MKDRKGAKYPHEFENREIVAFDVDVPYKEFLVDG